MAWRDVSDGMTVALQPSVTQWPGWQWSCGGGVGPWPVLASLVMAGHKSGEH